MNIGSEEALERKKEGGALIRGEALIRDYTVSGCAKARFYSVFRSCLDDYALMMIKSLQSSKEPKTLSGVSLQVGAL